MKKIIYIAPEILHYHLKFSEILKEKGVKTDIISSRKKNYQYNFNEKSYYNSFFLILRKIILIKNIFICGYSTNKHILILFFLRFLTKNKNVYICTDSNNFDRTKKSIFFRQIFFKFLFSSKYYFITPGKNTDKYLSNFFISTKKFNFLNYPFKITKPNRKKLLAKDITFILVARWVPEKNINQTIASLNELKLKNKIIIKLFTDNIKQANFLTQIHKNPMIEYSISNFIKNEELLTKIYDSHLLILLSKYEPWGIIVEESSILQTPCIISNKMGVSELAGICYKGLYKFNETNLSDLFHEFINLCDHRNTNDYLLIPRCSLQINSEIDKCINTFKL